MKELRYILGSLMISCLLGVVVSHFSVNEVINHFIPDINYFSIASK